MNRTIEPDPSNEFLTFTREEWAALRASVPLIMTEADLSALRGINEALSLEEVEAIYLPLARLLNLHIAATRQLRQVTTHFLGSDALPATPFIIGLAGSVAVGKSTIARLLQVLLARWPDHSCVDLVTTDGFLFPNAVLEERGLMARKGFPESYDLGRLVRFVREIKRGADRLTAPVYSHLVYDILPDQVQIVTRPDILIVEGLNVLQRPAHGIASRTFVSDFFDFSIYVDAEETLIRQWFHERFRRLRETAFTDPQSFFRRFAELPEAEAMTMADTVWDTINGVNLRENIAPTREQADLILEKGPDHAVQQVYLRR